MTSKAKRDLIAFAIAFLAILGTIFAYQAAEAAESPKKPVQIVQEDSPEFNCKTMGNKSGCENATTDWDKDGKTGNDDPYLNDPTR